MLPNAHVADAATVAAIRDSTFAPIFNGHSAGEAPLRHMGRDARAWAPQLEERFTQILGAAGLLRCADAACASCTYRMEKTMEKHLAS